MLILAISLFPALFLMGFQPFGSPTPHEQIIVYSIITLVVLSFTLIGLPRLLPDLMDSSRWTLGKFIWHSVLNLLVVSTAIAIYTFSIKTEPVLLYDPPFWEHLLRQIWRTFIIGIFPLVGMAFILENRALSQALLASQEATGRLESVKSTAARIPEAAHGKVNIQSDTRESLSMDRSNFLCARAEDNYIEITWMEGEGTKSKLLRMPMTSLYEQVGDDFIIRCHRSYMVNLRYVHEVSGNANGYRLHFNVIPADIPVSRTLGSEVLERIRSLSDRSVPGV